MLVRRQTKCTRCCGTHVSCGSRAHILRDICSREANLSAILFGFDDGRYTFFWLGKRLVCDSGSHCIRAPLCNQFLLVSCCIMALAICSYRTRLFLPENAQPISKHRQLKSARCFAGRHLYAIITGFCLIYYPFGSGCLHALVPSTITYVVMNVVRPQAASLAWIINFTYLIGW